MTKFDRFQGDPYIFMSSEAGDIFKGGQPVMDQGLENAVLISLFTREGWHGNALIDNPKQRIGSKFEQAANQPITRSSINQTRNAADRALAWMIDTRIVSKVTVRVTNPTGQRIDTEITLEPPGQDVLKLLLTRNASNWIYQKLYPAHERGPSRAEFTNSEV
jgi:phage gp46-like protein